MKKITTYIIFFFLLGILLSPTIIFAGDKKIGEPCGNGECASGDCETSDLKLPNAKFCVCQTAKDCAQNYDGDKGNESEWRCIDEHDNNYYDLYYCEKKNSDGSYTPVNPLQNTTDPQILSAIEKSGGISLSNAIDAITDAEGSAKQFQNEIAQILQKPQPKINIPGLNFSDINVEEMVTTDAEGTTWLNIPFLGEYLSAVYKYAVVIMGLIAVIGLIHGGVVWTISGSTSEGKQAAQKRIMGSVIGVVIVSTSYILLFTINPELVQFRNLRVQYIKGIELPTFVLEGEYDGSDFFGGTDLYDPTVSLPTSIKHIGQCSPGVGNIPYGCGNKTLCSSGCGLVSMAMVLNKPPAELAQLMVSEGWRGNGKKGATCNGTSWTGMQAIAKEKYDLQAELLYKIEKANEVLIKGIPLIVHVQNLKRNDPTFKKLSKEEQQKQSTCKFTRAGHYIVLTGYDPVKQIYAVADPGVSNPPPERTQSTAEHLINGCKVGGFLYIHK